MAENTMPAIEVENVEMEGETDSPEVHSYELAFHVLPTIAEGEVEGVFASIKDVIKREGGEIFDEEVPERFELAYEVVRHLEGKNRGFKSAYFGWVRFRATGAAAVVVNAEIELNNSILRHLLIKLTRVEEENPFRFHDAVRELRPIVNIDEPEAVPAVDEEVAAEGEKDDEVDEESLDKALEGKEV